MMTKRIRCIEGGDEEAADETEDEDVALHDGVVEKYIADCRGLSPPPKPFLKIWRPMERGELARTRK